MKIKVGAHDLQCPEDTPFTGDFEVVLSLEEGSEEVCIETDANIFTINLDKLSEAVSTLKKFADEADCAVE